MTTYSTDSAGKCCKVSMSNLYFVIYAPKLLTFHYIPNYYVVLTTNCPSQALPRKKLEGQLARLLRIFNYTPPWKPLPILFKSNV